MCGIRNATRTMWKPPRRPLPNMAAAFWRAVTPLEGQQRGRNVVIEFDSVEQAKACYDSAQYQKAAAIRQMVADADMIIVEGHEG